MIGKPHGMLRARYIAAPPHLRRARARSRANSASAVDNMAHNLLLDATADEMKYILASREQRHTQKTKNNNRHFAGCVSKIECDDSP